MNNIEYLKKYYKGNINDAMARLSNGEPLQYIIGNVDFCGYIYNVNKNVLIPRFETEELVDYTIKYIQKYFDNCTVLDLCTGSGCIGLTIKNTLPYTNVVLSDISSEALSVAKINSEKYQSDVSIIESDLFENIKSRFDVIISNPPYIAYDDKIEDIVYNNEPHIALYANCNGLYFYQKIFKNCEQYLNNRYIIAVEIGDKQKNMVIDIIHKYLKDVIIIVKKDASMRDRMIFVFKNIMVNE